MSNHARPRRKPSLAVAFAVTVALLVAAGIFLLRGRRRGPTAPIPTRFQDVTREAGIQFVHYNGAFGKKLFPEMMGSGAAWLDADGDGYLDLLLINSASLPGDPHPRRARNAFYRNLGNGRFEDQTERSGLAGGGYGMGAAVGDIDNDGHPDVFITNLGKNHLYHNRGNGTFEDVTDRMGVGHVGYGSSAAFLDYDNDGFEDLFVCNYTALPTPIERIVCRNPRGGRQYCDVHLYDGLPALLYHNNRGTSFTDVSMRSGIGRKPGRGLAVLCGDVNDDGFTDILVANDENPNYLWMNNHDGTFTERAGEAGIAYDQRGETIAGMGLDFGDVNRDGQLDVYESGFQGEPKIFFHRDGPGVFSDRTNTTGIGELSRQYLSFGLGFFDYDLDGWLDLLITNGHVIDDVTEFNPQIPYEQKCTLFRNTGGGHFVDASADLGTYAQEHHVGRGAAFADFDNDGDVDVLITNNHQRAVLLRNENPHQNHWLSVRCIGTRCTRDALGARVTVQTETIRQLREIHAAAGYLCSNDLRANFGLGSALMVDQLEVSWPGGGRDVFRNLRADSTVTVTQEKGISGTSASARR